MDRAIARARRSERRRSRRRAPSDLPWLVEARLRPGRKVSVIDVSRDGMLVEAGCRLLPGTRVALHLSGPGAGVHIHGRVLRCQVHALDPQHGVKYRAALTFDEGLTILGEG